MQTTSYKPPLIELLAGPKGQNSVNVGRGKQVLLLSAGGETVTLKGTNFGPDERHIANFYITYQNHDLQGLAVRTRYLVENLSNKSKSLFSTTTTTTTTTMTTN
jgi:carbamoylphosphate synthase small subunit